MARGWESKSVEEQIETAEARKAQRKHADALTAEEVRISREREALQMQLTRVRRECEAARHPRHREQLQAAIGYLEEKLAEMELAKPTQPL